MIFPCQDFFQDTQSDLEVIIEFLEEYYKQNTGENGKKKAWKINYDTKSQIFEHVFDCYSRQGVLDIRRGPTSAVLRATCEYQTRP